MHQPSGVGMRWMLWDPRWEVEKYEVGAGSVLWEVDETFFQRFRDRESGVLFGCWFF